MTQAEKLLELEADKQAAIDDDVDGGMPVFQALWSSLLTSATERDLDLWASLGADLGTTLDDLTSVPAVQRDPLWSDMFADMLTAAFRQAWHEVFGLDFLEAVERRNGRITGVADAMTTADIQAAGKVGFGKEQIKQRRQARAAKR